MFLCNSVFKKPFVVGTLVLSVVVLERSIRFAGGINSLICLFLFSLLIAGVAPSLRWREGQEVRVSAPAWRQTRHIRVAFSMHQQMAAMNTINKMGPQG
jgi:hypothetical protein